MGDRVFSIDLETGEKVVNTVSWVQGERYTEKTYTIYVGDEEITTTHEHPFYVQGEGWIAAEDLEVGDMLMTADGTYLPIENIVQYMPENLVRVFNFTVEGTHNYLVTETGILVHNVSK